MKDLGSGWEELATELELGEANVRKIRKENKTDREKAYSVLTMWTDKEGEDATLERLVDTLEKIAESIPVEKMLESEERVDDQGEVNRLLKKAKDEISIENGEKEASGESSEEAVLKELGIQLPEGKIAEKDEDDQKEVAKLLKKVHDEISIENRRKEGRKETSLEAASKEASSREEKNPKKRGSKKEAKPMTS
ncbi:uncharacterized protein LOC110067069 [Orbicella faveolata]|uniref:uncharacterized protein LOC110067069 n=1 Tax=Orbicella faveolata TaxID=48498 RepID=UPI0009E2BD28|nr:uncharacterized protein LOC110067069 [Orbicella faveolata]